MGVLLSSTSATAGGSRLDSNVLVSSVNAACDVFKSKMRALLPPCGQAENHKGRNGLQHGTA